MLTAIETTGTIEQNGKIVIDEIFSVDAPTSAHVIVLFPDAEDINENEWRQRRRKTKRLSFCTTLMKIFTPSKTENRLSNVN